MLGTKIPLLEACRRLAQNDPTLRELDLRYRGIDDKDVEALANALKKNTTLKGINLQHNRVGDDGADLLAEALFRNTTLSWLHLGNNRIGDAGAEVLSIALDTNTTLTKLDLQHNQIGIIGAKALLRTTRLHNGSLAYLYLLGNSGISYLESEIEALVEQNKSRTRTLVPRPLTWKEAEANRQRLAHKVEQQRHKVEAQRQRDAEKNLPDAAHKGRWKMLVGLLDHAVNVDALDNDGSTALYHACYHGQVDAARLLMDRGANVNVVCKGGKTPLMVASKNGHGDVVQLLLIKGANAELRVGRFRKLSALDMAEQKGHSHVISVLKAHKERQEELDTPLIKIPEAQASPQKSPSQKINRERVQDGAAKRQRAEEVTARQQERREDDTRLENDASEQTRPEQEAEMLPLEQEGTARHGLLKEETRQDSKQGQFQKDCADRFRTRAALDQELQRLQDFVEAASGVTDPDVKSAVARAKAEYEALVPLRSLPQWASVSELEKQIASLEARLRSIDVGAHSVSSANELQELKYRLDMERLTPEQFDALQKLTSKIKDFDRSLESVQGLPEEIKAMPKHVQAYFFAFCQAFQRTYLAAEVISSGAVEVSVSSKFQGTIAAVLGVVGKGLECSNVPFLGCASIIISLYTYHLKTKQNNFLWVFQDFFNSESRDGYMLTYRCIAKKICMVDDFSYFQIGMDENNNVSTMIRRKIKKLILEPLNEVVSRHLRGNHLMSLEEMDPIGLKVISDLHTITLGVLQLWEEDRDRYNHLKQAEESEKAAFVLECLGIVATGSCSDAVGVDLQTCNSAGVQTVDLPREQGRRTKEVTSKPAVEQYDRMPEEAAKLSELEQLRAEVRLLASENKRNREKIKQMEKLIPDDNEGFNVGVGDGCGLQQALISDKSNLHSHSLQGSRMDEFESLRTHLESLVSHLNRQSLDIGYRLFLVERVLSFSEALQLTENILLRSSDSISGMENNSKAVRPHEAVVPDNNGLFVIDNRKLRIGTVPDSKEKLWKRGQEIKIFHDNNEVKSVRHWFVANGLGYRFQLHCKPVVLAMFSDEIAMAYDTFESIVPELGVPQDDEIEDAKRSSLFHTYE